MNPQPQKPRTIRWVYLLPLVVILALGGVFGKRLMDIEGGLDPSLLPTVLLDTPVPAFKLAGLPGRGEGLSSDDLKGQVTLLNVWGSWCIGCVQEHPTLMDIAESGEVVIHGVDWRDDPDKAIAWLAKNGDPYGKIGVDPKSEVAIAFGITAAPETFVIDANGIIRYKHIGVITPEVWRNVLRPLIGKLKEG